MDDRLKELDDFGPCCACGKPHDDTVRNIVMLDRRALQAGTGWGCVVCGLPSDGAIAVLCDSCIDGKVPAQQAVDGFIVERRRVPIDQLPAGVFGHDLKKHRAFGPSAQKAKLN